MATTSSPAQQDFLATELAEMSESVRLGFVRGLIQQWERTSDFHAQACEAHEEALAQVAVWKARYDEAQAKLDAILQLIGGVR